MKLREFLEKVSALHTVVGDMPTQAQDVVAQYVREEAIASGFRNYSESLRKF